MPEVSPELERLVALLQEAKGELRHRYGVKEIALFGSYVRGENRPTRVVSRVMCKSLCTGGIPLLKHLLQHLLHLREPL